MGNGLTRRDLLWKSAGAMLTAAGFSMTRDMLAQVTGSMPGGGTVPLRMPAGALDYLDRKQYLHNMEIHAHVQPTAGGGEPWPMWARGKQRILVGASFEGGGGLLDVTEPTRPVLMPQRVSGQLAYATHLKKWILASASMIPITAPNPKYPRGKYHEEYNASALAFKGLRGIRTYDVTDPTKPNVLQEYSTGDKGGGCTTPYYDGGRYAYYPCAPDESYMRHETSERVFTYGLLVVDMWDPANVKEVSRWWVPGQRIGEETEYNKWPFANDQSSAAFLHDGVTVPKRVEDGGTVGYGGWGHFGFYVHDFSDIKNPKIYGHTTNQLEALGGIPYHSVWPVLGTAAYPRLQNKVIATFEALESDCREPWHTQYVIDVKDRTRPKIIGLFPRPVPDPAAPYTDFCQARGRFASHNPQAFIAPGAVKGNIVVMAYTNAGIRVFDISDPREPKEVAYFVPARDGDINDWESWRRGTGEFCHVEWDRNLIWFSTHEGTYCLSCPALGKPVLEPRRVTRWSLPHVNVGWDDQAPKTVYFGRGLSELA